MRAAAIYPSIDVFCRDLIEDSPDAIIYADTGGMIRFWNRGAERIFGFTPSEAIGRSLDLIIPEPLRQRHWDAYLRAIRTGQMRYGAGDVLAVPGKRKDGTRVSIEFCVRPFRNREGRTVGIAAILRDVSRRFEEIKALRREVAALRERLEACARTRMSSPTT